MSRPKKNITTDELKEIPIVFSDKVDEDRGDIKIQKTRKEQSKELLKKFVSEETKVVKGKFRNFEVPGGSQRIIVKKYADVPLFDKVMEDGGIYEIPLYVAKHLNGVDATAKQINGKINTCAYPTHGFKYADGRIPESREEGGMIVPLIVPAKWTRRYGFESLEFDTEL